MGDGEQIEEDPSSKVTCIPAYNREVEGAAGEIPGPRRPGAGPPNLSAMALEDPPPHLKRPLVYLGLWAWTANNRLRLADAFSTFAGEPAALAQLSICRKGSRGPEEKSF